MPDLLTLPRELRDLIYREVLRGATLLRPSGRPRVCLMPRSPSPPAPLEAFLRRSSGPVLQPTAPDPSGPASNGVPAPDEVPAASDTPAANGAPAPANAAVAPGAAVAVNGTAAATSHAHEPAALSTASSASEPLERDGEITLRYSLAEAVPPTRGLLGTCHLVRSEMQEMIARQPVHYRIDLAYRNDGAVIYPTWLSVPSLAKHVDRLEVTMRMRDGKTASVFSGSSSVAAPGRDDSIDEDPFLGGMVLLRRFLERGPFFLGRKRADRRTTIGRIVLRIDFKERRYRSERSVFIDTVEMVDDLFLEPDDAVLSSPCIQRRADFLAFFADRVALFECRIGAHAWEWDMAAVGAAVRANWDPAVVNKLVPRRISSYPRHPTFQDNDDVDFVGYEVVSLNPPEAG